MQSKEESKSAEPVHQSTQKALKDAAKSYNEAFFDDNRLLIHQAAHRRTNNLSNMSAQGEEINSLHLEAAMSGQHLRKAVQKRQS